MSVESLPEHLLEQAEHLARRERTRPRQASLRRAVSTSYYALFHWLIRDAVRQVGPNLSEELFNRAYRWFDHGAMYQVAKAFRLDIVHIPNGKGVLIQANHPALRLIAQQFVELQELRHAADYDPAAQFLREDVSAVIDALKASFQTWPAVRITPEGNAFLLSLLLWDKWGKRP